MLRSLLRYSSTMAIYRPTASSPFTRAVVKSMRKLYPEALAEKSFDNTGLLLEAPFNITRKQKNSVLLAVDLTRAVADEAIARKDSIVIAYHPIIFRGLKSITLNNSQQDSLLRLAQEGISVYSPHTAVDAVPDGMADWLCDVVTGPVVGSHPGSPIIGDTVLSNIRSRDELSSPDEKPPLPPRGSPTPQTPAAILPHMRTTILPNPSPPAGFEGAGTGRLVTLNTPEPLTSLIKRIANITGKAVGVPVALPQCQRAEDINIRTIATCPGSGSSILMQNGQPVADLLLTGEMSHHDALAAIERGSVVISLFHSNSERGYLSAVMKGKLLADLENEWDIVRSEVAGTLQDDDAQMRELLSDESFAVDVSETDRDPYEIVPLTS